MDKFIEEFVLKFVINKISIIFLSILEYIQILKNNFYSNILTRTLKIIKNDYIQVVHLYFFSHCSIYSRGIIKEVKRNKP